MDIVHYVSKLQNVFLIRNDDDLADRLNYRYTVAILIAFAVIVSNRQFSETVIKCWVPAFFTPNYETYANQVCWVSNTYYVNQTQNVPKGEEARKKNEIKYYQWIPFILLIQALFLYIPRILWRLLSARAGLDMRDLVEAAHSYKSVEKFGCKKKIMEYIVHNIDQYASNPRRSKAQESIFNKIKYFGESLFCGSGIYLGNYLVTTYFFIKIVYLVNSIVQFFIMNEFLGKQFHELGLDILRYLTNSYSLENSIESVYFPKVVMCDFHIREFGHPNFSHKYTIQCVLPINLYNQQIFTFLWFWFLLLFFANCYALAQWISRMLPRARRRYVNRRLNMLNYFQTLNVTTSVVLKRTRRSIFGSSRRRAKPVSLEAKRQKRKFIDEYLKFDGVFILRMIAMLTSELVGTELLHELWNKRAGGVLGLGDAYDDGSVYGGGSFHERHHGGSEIRKAPIGFYTGPPPTISTSDYENMMNKESNFQTSPEHQHHHHHHNQQQQQQQEITDNDANLITTNVVEIGGLSMEQQQQQPPSMSPPLGMMMMGDQTLEPPLRASPVPLSMTNSESDSRRSSTKRRVMDMAAMRLRHQYSMESAPAPPMSPPVASLQQQQQQPAAPSLPFNRISRQRLKRLTRESSQRAGDELAVDNLSSTSMPTQAPSPTPQMNVVPPSVAAAIMSSAPAQRSSGSSLRQSILGGVSALRKMSSDSTSKLQQMQQMQQSTNMTPTNIPASSVSSISHGGSVKQPKKVAFAKSELDDYDEQLVFKPHEFDDVFSDLKFES